MGSGVSEVRKVKSGAARGLAQLVCRGLGCWPVGQAKGVCWAVSVHKVKGSVLHAGGGYC